MLDWGGDNRYKDVKPATYLICLVMTIVVII